MRKIMFNDHYGLTRSVLDGRKTQTRRIIEGHTYVKPMATLCQGKLRVNEIHKMEEISHYSVGETIAVAQSYKSIHDTIPEKSGNFGPVHLDMLPKIYIKGLESLIETAKNSSICEVLKHQDKSEIIPDTGIREHEIPAPENQSMFRQTGENAAKEFSEQFKKQDNLPDLVKDTYFDTFSKIPGWKNKMFVRADLMPHQIRITNIRLERLQDISDEDCLAEGIRRWEDEEEYSTSSSVRKSIGDLKAAGYEAYAIPGYWDCYTSPKKAYAALIEKVSGKGTWEKNPWVFVYDFELVK